MDSSRVVDGTISATDVNVAEIQRRVSGSCSAGQYVRVVNQDGTVTCEADSIGGGTVTNVATGNGLTGGPITGSGTVAIAPGGIGAAQIDPAQVQSRVTGNCAPGLFVRAVSQDGGVVCDPAGVGSITGVTADTGLTGGGTSGVVAVGIAPGGVGATEIDATEVQSRVTGSCAIGQYVRGVNANGSVVCDNDGNSGGSVTSIATGTGLTGGPITSSGTIAVANGGIGATQINTAQVQSRVVGTCPAGEYVRGVNQDGSVNCAQLAGQIVGQFLVYDAEDTLIGSLASSGAGFDIWTPQLYRVRINENGSVAGSVPSLDGVVMTGGPLIYTGYNCAGPAYVEVGAGYGQTVVRMSGNPYTLVAIPHHPVVVVVDRVSYRGLLDGTCANTGGSNQWRTAMLFSEIINDPAVTGVRNEPYVGPLRLETHPVGAAIQQGAQPVRGE